MLKHHRSQTGGESMAVARLALMVILPIGLLAAEA
jgi:hypothetical protein